MAVLTVIETLDGHWRVGYPTTAEVLDAYHFGDNFLRQIVLHEGGENMLLILTVRRNLNCSYTNNLSQRSSTVSYYLLIDVGSTM